MEDNELKSIWQSYDQKLDQVLTINQQMARELTQLKFNKTIDKLKLPKRTGLLLGIPFLMILVFLTFIGFKAGGVFFTLGFACITLINLLLVIIYIYHLIQISKIDNSENILEVQEGLTRLRVSSFNSTRLAIFQIPFWSLCWISWEVLKQSPLLYGGVNLLVFASLCYFSYWLYKRMDLNNPDSKVGQFFFSGPEWTPIIKASKLLKQLEEYRN